jgi:hypothetical protein
VVGNGTATANTKGNIADTTTLTASTREIFGADHATSHPTSGHADLQSDTHLIECMFDQRAKLRHRRPSSSDIGSQMGPTILSIRGVPGF